MTEDNFKSFKDRKSFEEIFNNIFAKNPLFIKLQELRIKCDYIGFMDDIIKLKIENLKETPKVCFLLARQADKIYSATLQLVKTTEKDRYVFKPIEIREYKAPRREERERLEPEKKTQVLFIDNIMSEMLIHKSLAFESKKVKQIGDVIKVKLEKTFQNIRMFFIHEGADPRMNYFRDNIRPIFIPNIRQEPSEKNKAIYDYYKENIYSKDSFILNQKNLISEISVPVLYRMKIPYGFVQVNNTGPLEETFISMVKKMAVIAEELMHKNNIFVKEDIKLLVANISRGGLGIAFKDRKDIKYFKENCMIYFDLLLPENKKANILACVRHISQINNRIYKVGCEFMDMDALSEVYFDEFLESLGSN